MKNRRNHVKNNKVFHNFQFTLFSPLISSIDSNIRQADAFQFLSLSHFAILFTRRDSLIWRTFCLLIQTFLFLLFFLFHKKSEWRFCIVLRDVFKYTAKKMRKKHWFSIRKRFSFTVQKKEKKKREKEMKLRILNLFSISFNTQA